VCLHCAYSISKTKAHKTDAIITDFTQTATAAKVVAINLSKPLKT